MNPLSPTRPTGLDPDDARAVADRIAFACGKSSGGLNGLDLLDLLRGFNPGAREGGVALALRRGAVNVVRRMYPEDDPRPDHFVYFAGPIVPAGKDGAA